MAFAGQTASDDLAIRTFHSALPAATVHRMELLLLLLGAAVGGAIGYNFGQRSQPSALQTHADDAVAGFLAAVNRKLEPSLARQVEWVAGEVFDDRQQAYIKAKVREIQRQANDGEGQAAS